ncbi:MAG: translation elongation factor Ts [Candidatus Faecenecus gallistercoris]|nr:translation elongation factor Ts [Bacillota bacterium]MDD7101943.1 translation elongation factor Ts [Bacillota bacterium]MDY4050443.1 translation elongation factor Ts [Candidatus Faecenecus gallistercoris]
MFKAEDVKILRERTNAGMMDCKKALEASNGDMDKAIDWLRENGKAKAAKKEARIAAEGTTKIVQNDNTTVIIEMNSETDFVASNAEFKTAVDEIANAILSSDVQTMEEANELTIDGVSVHDYIVNLTAKIGEKLTFRRFARISKSTDECIGVYSHMGGRIGVVALLKGNNVEVAKDVAMHTAAMNPGYVTREDVPEDVKAHEESVIKAEVMKEGKPENIAEKMVAGRMNKFFKENCLVEQEFIKDSSMTVGDYVKNNGCEIVSITRFEVGEGIEKKEENFAQEVMSQIQG